MNSTSSIDKAYVFAFKYHATANLSSFVNFKRNHPPKQPFWGVVQKYHFFFSKMFLWVPKFFWVMFGVLLTPRRAHMSALCAQPKKSTWQKKKGPENDHFWSFSKYGKFKYSFFWSIKHKTQFHYKMSTKMWLECTKTSVCLKWTLKKTNFLNFSQLLPLFGLFL